MIKHLEKKIYLPLILTFLLVLEIFFFSSISNFSDVGTGPSFLSVLYHLIIFFLLGFFILVSVIGEKKIKISYLIFSIVVSICFAILDEVHQLFVPGRFFSIKDILVDTLGILIATFIYRYIKIKN